MHDRICTKQYSFKTEQSYLNWIKRYILFHDNWHPNELTAEDLETYHRGEKAATPACSSFKPVIITTIFWMMMFLMIMNIIGLGAAFFLPTLLCVALTIIIISWYRDLYTDENKKYFVFLILLDTLRWGCFLAYLLVQAPFILNITLFMPYFFLQSQHSSSF